MEKIMLLLESISDRLDVLVAAVAKQPKPERWLSIKEVAVLLGVGDDKVRALRASGQLPSTNLGSTKPTGQRWHIRASDVETFMRRGK